FGLALKTRAKRFALCGDAHRASVQMALPGHHASDGQQRGRAKAEFVSSQNRCEHDIARKLQASVHAEREARTEASANQSVMCFAQTDFPRQTCVFDRREWGRTRAAVVSTDGNYVSSSFRNSCRNDAYARSGNKLHANPRPRVHRAQIVNQLRQVFDAVNVMMRRR